MENVVAKALDFATKAHGDQVRKYTGEPYTNHLVEVMNIVRTVKSDDSMLAAALLHDTIEDTSVTEADVKKEFGDRIAQLVVELTDISKFYNQLCNTITKFFFNICFCYRSIFNSIMQQCRRQHTIV